MRSQSRVAAAAVAVLLACVAASGCDLQLLGAPRGPLTLYAHFEDVEGLVVGNSVQINNVVVGSVVGLRLDPRRYRADVTMSLRAGHPVPVDATVTIRQTTLLGEYYVDIEVPVRRNGAPLRYLPNGGELANASTTAPVEDVVARAGALLDAVNAHDVSAIITAGSQALAGRGPQLHNLIGQASQLLAAFAGQRDQIGAAVDNLASLGSSLAPLSDQFASLLDSVNNATAQLVRDRDQFFTALRSFTNLLTTANDTIIVPHAQQFTELITEANAILGTLNSKRAVLAQLADDLSMSIPRLTRVVSKDQVLVASWGELPQVGAR